ncbi:MAG TPA: kelch repeat-containing protein [Opitutaceae bacterium]|nr:kelch repeat-containing protein [Opitutaceae bacterium]
MHAADPADLLTKVATFHLKHARYGATALADGDYLYVVGGSQRGELITNIERMHGQTGQSVKITDEIIPRQHGCATMVNRKIYIFGGWTHGQRKGDPDGRVEMFDLATGRLTQVARMPKPRAHMTAVVRGGKVHLIGGQMRSKDSLVQTSVMEIYDPATDRWSEGPPMPTPRETDAVLVGDFVLALGGFAGNAAVSKVELFVPAENVWKALPDLMRRTSAHSAAFLGEHVFLFGDYGSLSSVLAYDLKNRTSRAIKPGLEGTRHSSAVAHNGRIYVVGGNTDEQGTALDLVQVFELRRSGAVQR